MLKWVLLVLETLHKPENINIVKGMDNKDKYNMVP